MDTTWAAYTGFFYYFGIAFRIELEEGQLVSAMVGVPPGFEIPLEPAGEHQFRMASGPLAGSTFQYTFAEDGSVSGLSAGGHDDGPLVRAQVLERRIYAAAFEARASGTDGRRLVFRPNEGVGEIMDEFIELNRTLFPGVTYQYDPGPPEALSIQNMPPAMIQVFDDRVRRREDLDFGN